MTASSLRSAPTALKDAIAKAWDRSPGRILGLMVAAGAAMAACNVALGTKAAPQAPSAVETIGDVVRILVEDPQTMLVYAGPANNLRPRRIHVCDRSGIAVAADVPEAEAMRIEAIASKNSMWCDTYQSATAHVHEAAEIGGGTKTDRRRKIHLKPLE